MHADDRKRLAPAFNAAYPQCSPASDASGRRARRARSPLRIGEVELGIAQQTHVVDQRIDQRTLEQVQRSIAEVRRLAVMTPVFLEGLRDRVGGDHNEAIGARIERRLDRCVQPSAAIEIPSTPSRWPVDPNAGKRIGIAADARTCSTPSLVRAYSTTCEWPDSI